MALSAHNTKKPPRIFEEAAIRFLLESAHTNLSKDALAGQEFSTQTDHETHHGEAAVPGFSEGREAKLAVHRFIKKRNNYTDGLARLVYRMLLSNSPRTTAAWS